MTAIDNTMIKEMLVENPYYMYVSDRWIKMLCFIDECGIIYPYYNRHAMTIKYSGCRVKELPNVD